MIRIIAPTFKEGAMFARERGYPKNIIISVEKAWIQLQGLGEGVTLIIVNEHRFGSHLTEFWRIMDVINDRVLVEFRRF